MKVYLNSEPITLDKGMSLYHLLSLKDFIDQKGIAVAVNNKVIRKQEWGSNVLNENDKVLIISATKGG